MIIYYSMVIWVFICNCIQRIYNNFVNIDSYTKTKPNKVLVFLTVIYMLVLIGLRSGVGDTNAYINIFENLPNRLTIDVFNSFEKDIGFFTLSVLFKQFVTQDYHLWLLTISLISGFLITKTIYRYSSNFYYSVFLFIVSLNMVWMLNGMRQFLALSIIFGNINYLLNNKNIKFFIIVLIAATIHITALFALLAFALIKTKPFSLKMIAIIVIILFIGINLDRIASIFSIVLEDSAYEGYLDVAANSAGSNILRTFVGLAPIVLAFFGRKTFYKNKFVSFLVSMSIVSALLYFISSLTGGILIGRIPVYFDMFNIILIPWLIENMFERKSSIIMYIVVAICYLTFFHMKATYGMNLNYVSDVLNLYY